MMNVKIQTSTSTKNSTVNAVGNLNRRLGSVVVSSGVACVSVIMVPAAGQRGWPAGRGTDDGRPGLLAGCLVPASWAHPQMRIGNLDSCNLLELRQGIITRSGVIPASLRRS